MFSRRFVFLQRQRSELLRAFVSADCVKKQGEYRAKLERVGRLLDTMIDRSLERAYKRRIAG